MTTWPQVSASDIAEKIAIGPFGSRMKTECYVNRGIPIIRGNNITDTKALAGEFVFISKEMAKGMSGCNAYDGDLVFPHRGLIGEVGIVTGGKNAHFFISSSLMKLTPKRDIADPLFYFYFYRSPAGRHELLKNASQVGTPGIATPLTSLRSTRVPLPPLSEQRAIASVLGALDDKIELNRRMNETLEGLAQTFFKSWFVDPAANGLPKGWAEAKLPDVIEINPPRRLQKGEIVSYLDMANMPTNSARALEVVDRQFGSGMRFMDGDTLVARITPCLENGKTCFVDFLGDGKTGWGSTEYIVLRPKPPLPPEFAYFLARTDEFRAFAISNMTGTTGRQRVPADCLDNYTVVLPPAELAKTFGEFAKAVFAKMKANDWESRNLGLIRDTLLPKLLSGELRVTSVNGS